MTSNDEKAQEPVEQTNIPELPDSIKKKIAKQDSLMGVVLSNIDTIRNEANITKGDVRELTKKVDDLKSPNPIWLMLCFVLSVIAVVVAIIAKRKSVNKKKAEELFREYLKNHNVPVRLSPDSLNEIFNQFQSWSKNNNVNKNNNRQPAPFEITELERRISELEKKLAAPQTIRQESPAPRQTYSKIAYVRSLNNGLFTGIDPSNQEGCVFKITFVNGEKGTFSLIKLNSLKPLGGIENFVDIEGNCTLNDANSFSEISSGECAKEGRLWKVTKRLRIKISK